MKKILLTALVLVAMLFVYSYAADKKKGCKEGYLQWFLATASDSLSYAAVFHVFTWFDTIHSAEL